MASTPRTGTAGRSAHEQAGRSAAAAPVCVLLRRWRDAVRDGDHVHAVVLGSAVNNDGAAKAGYTAPGVHGQTAVITEAMAVAGVSPDEVGYVEAHGTGTQLGDLVEIEALTRAFRHDTDRHAYCAIGSVKSNIGHLDAAAGAAGLIKVVLAVEHSTIPASLHCDPPNEKTDFASTPFVPCAATMPWPSGAERRVSGVSSFGIGGTNAHVVVGEAPATARVGTVRRVQALVWSARDEAALVETGARLGERLRDQPSSMASLAVTLAGRRTHRLRAAVVATSSDEAVAALAAMGQKDTDTAPACAAGSSGVTMLFPAQPGANRLDEQLRNLYRHEPVFRRHLTPFLDVLDGLGVGIHKVVDGPATSAPGDVVPTLVALQIALAHTLLEWGVRPEAVAADGVGLHAAAVVAGALTPGEALRLAVTGGEPGQLREALAGVRVGEPSVPVASLRDGRWVTAEDLADPRLWLASDIRAADLQDGLAMVLRHRDGVLLEVGPVDTLTQLFRDQSGSRAAHVPLATASAGPPQGKEDLALVTAVARAWTAGADVDWPSFHDRPGPARVPAPPYPLRRRRFWIDPPPPGTADPPPAQSAGALTALTAGLGTGPRPRRGRRHGERRHDARARPTVLGPRRRLPGAWAVSA